MFKKMFAASLSTAMIAAPALVFADQVDSVSVDSISVEICGEQAMTFTGAGTYSEFTQHLIIDLDGEVILYDTDEPAVWSAGPVVVTEGEHTLTATVYDKSDLVTVLAQDSVIFSTSCEGDNGEGDGDEEGNEDEEGSEESNDGDGDDGDEQSDTGASTHEPGHEGNLQQSKVAGATSKKASGLPAKLKPLNSIFRLVYGRTPTFQEWTYWANRLLTDKPQYDALYGAMQWHKLRGHTIGS